MARKKEKPESPVTKSLAIQPANVQSGDLQGLPDLAGADSESVRELVEEGQAFEAALVDAIENVPDADEGEIKVKEVAADDVPPEYVDRPTDEPKEE